MQDLDETSFIDTVTEFVANLRGPEQEPIDADANLITDSGLDSLQLIALLRFVEKLRGEELLDAPDLEGLTLRSAYQLLYKRQSAPV